MSSRCAIILQMVGKMEKVGTKPPFGSSLRVIMKLLSKGGEKMYKTAKTAIRVYGKLGRTAKEIEGLIGRVALGSFSDVAPCSDICERMCLLIEKKNILINLKVKITEALRALSEEDRALLAVKFGKNKRELYLSRRTYFRRLNGALSAFEAELARQGVTEGAIADYYGKNIFINIHTV